MKFISRSALILALLIASAVRADHVGLDLSGTSPSTVTTAVGATSATQIGMFSTCSFYVAAQGGTGGTLDIYIQTLFKQINTAGIWVDVAHLPQIAGGGALTGYTFVLTRWSPTTSAIFTPVNTVSATPVLAVNTTVPGVLGYQLRVVYKTGAGTSAGAAQTVLATCSDT